MSLISGDDDGRGDGGGTEGTSEAGLVVRCC